ncbi:MAG: chromosome segregation protein SMC, partial [Pseudomonadota bacterium]|nr:chromosome segregation protein SMC [Pseudomonadota bacterium]
IGESSAKNLRAESMADVIFNGTTNRKPVGQASIELIFDNTDGRLSTEFAKYNELSIRRVLHRDGQSQYFLNGTRCRRKDVLDVFLGTGLGARSYSIIEQGMISRIIEAKPEDLRVFLEEAAGISKYKERRKETETRIRHTRENLDRLKDLREELEKQLEKLKRQASAAERYKVLKQEHRVFKAQLHLMHLQTLHESLQELSEQIQQNETDLTAQITAQHTIDKNVELIRVQHTEHNDYTNDIQEQFYKVGSEISKLEQTIQHAIEREQQLSHDLTQLEDNFSSLDEQVLLDQDQLKNAQNDLQQIEESARKYAEDAANSTEILEEAQQRLQLSQQAWDQFQTSMSDAKRQAEVSKTQQHHLANKAESLQTRRARLQEQLTDLCTEDLSAEIELEQESVAERQELLSTIHSEVDQAKEQITEQRRHQHEQQLNLQSAQGNLQRLEARQSSLNALQEMAVGRKNTKQNDWLQRCGLNENDRLVEQLQVVAGWEKAVETVLDQHLEAVCVNDFSEITAHINELGDANISFFNIRANADVARHENAESIASKVTSTLPIEELLSGIYVTDDLASALALVPQLAPHESVVTRDGIWLSHTWLKVQHAVDEHTGVLARQQEITELEQQISEHQSILDEHRERLAAVIDQLNNAEQNFEQKQQQLRELSQQIADLRSNLSAKTAKLSQLQERTERLRDEMQEVSENLTQVQNDIEAAEAVVQQAEEALESSLEQENALRQQRDAAQEQYRHVQQNSQLARQKADEMQIRCESIRNQIRYLEQGIARASDQIQQMIVRRDNITQTLSSLLEPIPEMRERLEEHLEIRLSLDTELTVAKQKLSEFDHLLRDAEKSRQDIESKCQALRSHHEQLRMSQQTAKVKAETHQEKIAETELSHAEIMEGLDDNANVREWQEKIEVTDNRIDRLGPINLAAIEEYEQLAERKTYLDQQDADLNEAMETLETAIRKIDKETRTKFKETFDAVNETFQTYFPKIFGGGQASLELIGDDLLDTGIGVKAQPPGKRNTTIHVLSGGEKALTAIALVFSFFQLNPAPFCILDEVDAPLDDANVGRYCNLVKEMSEKVQFLFISHNKIAIEMAKQLCGVTMHEPGVSRLVSVDIDEAIEMATN